MLAVRVIDVREHASGRHRVTDDAPYGGGAGMVMKPEPLTEAIEAARARLPGALVVLTSPRGARLDQALARRLAEHGRVVIACGRYEGVDERVRAAVDEEVSLGDFVLTGGELAALGDRGRGGAARARRARQRAVGGRGELCGGGRGAGAPSLHPPPGLPGDAGSGGPAVRGSPADRAVAAARGAAGHPGTAPRPLREAGADGRRPPAPRRPATTSCEGEDHAAQGHRDIEAKYLRKDLPDFGAGDTVRVHTKIKEGDKERIQVFEGVVIRHRRGQASAMFTVRKMSYGVGVERSSPSTARASTASR